MSRAHEYNYRLEAEIRQQIYNQRVRETTTGFYERYLEQYENMKRQGFEEFIPNEMSRLRNDLESLSNLLVINPKLAREESFEIGTYIHSMHKLGRSAIRDFDQTESIQMAELKKEMKENKSEILDYYYQIINVLKDPVVRDFAAISLKQLKKKISTKDNISNDELKKLKRVVDLEMEKIITKAEIKADKWKEERLEEQSIEVDMEVLESVEKYIQENGTENNEKNYQFLEKIRRFKSQVINGGEIDVSSEVKNIIEEVDTAFIEESERRAVVKAIVESLRAQEFSVQMPKLVKDEKNNYVKIVGKKPSGKQAECRVDVTGTLRYKFDKYEGMTCLKDVEQMNVDLEKIYSVNLSDERVIWENPNRISKDSKPLTSNNTRWKK